LERIEADLPLNTNYFAAHNFSAPARTVNELRAGLRNGSFGKGSTAEQGEASALMEAIERYSGIFQGDEIRVTRRFTDFASAMRSFRMTSYCLARHSLRRIIRTRRRPGPRPYLIHRRRSNGHRFGLCATDVSNIFRLASCIFSIEGSASFSRIP